MTTLRKLSLQGIRSYSDQTAEVIEFFRPLTIIVGANGSGKTTIIEALKFICTGEQPPLSDKGKSFVHDPRVVGMAIVKAQIKLAFRTADDRPVLAIRSFQLSHKKQKSEYKAIESVLRTINSENKQVSISHRCADMEKQEDSSWPLGDSKTLKAKFDDIFAATRYTKALNVIRKLRKEKVASVKEMEADLKILDNDHERAVKLAQDVEACKSKIKDKEAKIALEMEECKKLEAKWNELKEKTDTVKQVQAMILQLETKNKVMSDEKEKAHERMQNEYNDSDEDLLQFTAKFRTDLETRNAELEASQKKLADLERRAARSAQQQTDSTKTLGRLEAQDAEHARKKATLQSESNRLSEHYGLRIEAKHSLSSFVDSVRIHVQRKRDELQAHKTESQHSDSNYERALAQLRAQESTVLADLKTKKSIRDERVNKLRELQKDMSRMDGTMTKLTNIQTDIRVAEDELKAFIQRETPEARRAEAETLQRSIDTHRSRMKVLSGERKELSGQTDAAATVRYKRAALDQKKNQYNACAERIRNGFTDAGGDVKDITPPSSLPSDAAEAARLLLSSSSRGTALESQLRAKSGELKSSAKGMSDKLSAAQKALSNCAGQLKMTEDTLHENDKTIQMSRDQFLAAGEEKSLDGKAGDSDDFQVRLDLLAARVEKLKSEKSMASSGLIFYKKFSTLALERHNCPLCHRQFDGDEEKKFLESNEQMVNRLKTGDSLITIKKNLKEGETEMSKLKTLQPAWNHFKKAQKERQTIDSKRSKLRSEHKNLSSQFDDCEQQLQRVNASIDRLAPLLHLGEELSRLFSEANDAQKQYTQAEDQMKARSSGARTLDMVQREYDKLEEANSTLNRQLTELNEALSRSADKKQELQEKVNKFREKGVELARLEMQKERFLKDKSELETEINSLQEELKKAEMKLTPLRQSIRTNESDRENARSERLKSEQTLNESLMALQRDADTIQSLREDVDRYELDASKRESVQKTLTAAKREADEAKKQISELHGQIASIKQSVDQSDNVAADIKANLEYRGRLKELAKQAELIAEKKAHLKELTRGDDLFLQIGDVNGTIQKMKEHIAQMRGGLASDTAHRDELTIELHSSKFKGIEMRLKHKFIEYRTTMMANADLDSYYKALDKALMHFHSIKMKSINETLKEYWRATYRGKDIDEISIHSDCTQLTKGKRQYNYRVVMKQGDTELNMRGRCSSGQKVLASLLIRLALAETFCLQCGVLALDEPTTNLDHANVRAFAAALTEIINKRREQKNFQLILITHDEQFVEEIGKRAHADYYYRVSKDDNQKSRIRKQPIRD